MVTSTFHIVRSRIIFRRALGCDLRFVTAGMNRQRLPRHAVSELAKLILALTLRRAP